MPALKTAPGAKQLNALLVAIILLVSSAVSLGAFAPAAHGQTSALVTVDPPSIADITITSGMVTFSVDVANSPPITGFGVSMLYNRAVLSLAPSGINIQGDILGQTGGTVVVGAECLDGSSIIGNCIPTIDDVGVISLLVVIQGQSVTPNPTNGLLFSLTFNVIGKGVSQLHFLRSILLNGLASALVPSQSVGGYFSNMICGNAICQPPAVQFTFTPSIPGAGVPITFDASSSLATNPGATLQVYVWNWRDTSFPSPATSTTPTIQHTFQFPGNHTVTLALNDSYGVVGSATAVVDVILLPDFTMTSPVFPVLGLGDVVTAPLVLISLHGFKGTVALSASFTQPHGAALPTVSLASSSLRLSPNGTNETMVTVSTTASTSSTFFELTFVGTSGSISHSVATTFTVVSAQPAVFAHFHWKHHVSIGRSGNDQTFVANILNPNLQAAIYVVVHVEGVGSDGLTTFATSSAMTQILPGQTSTDIPINGVFSAQEAGLRFSFSTQISWGLNPSSLSRTSTQAQPGVSTTGTFVIAP